MFQKGQSVVCVDEKMKGIVAILTRDKVYRIAEFISPEDCAETFADHPAQWHKEGGRVEVEEERGSYWFGRRFQVR